MRTAISHLERLKNEAIRKVKDYRDSASQANAIADNWQADVDQYQAAIDLLTAAPGKNK